MSKCKKCDRKFTMGVDGTVDGCDGCTGTKRDKNGYAWRKGERVHTYQDLATGEISKVKATIYLTHND